MYAVGIRCVRVRRYEGTTGYMRNNMQEVIHTAHHAGGDTCRTSCRTWHIPHIMQEVIRTAHHAAVMHTAHHAGGDTYRASCRRWYIPHIMQAVMHTAHHARGDTYRTSCRRWYMPRIMQEVIHTAYHAGGDIHRASCRRWYKKSSHFRGLQPWWSDRVFSTKHIHTLTHTYSYKHGISSPSVHFSSVLFIH
jgi:hypothetical protein